VIAAIVTPPDVLSQLLLAIPMCLLYELGLLIARFYLPKTQSQEEKSE
jgi:sec-independent protein translocase protein TatC